MQAHIQMVALFVALMVSYVDKRCAVAERTYYAELGKDSDKISCGSTEWQQFSIAVQKYCSKMDACAPEFGRAFKECRIRDVNQQYFYKPVPFSRKQVTFLPIGAEFMYSTRKQDDNFTIYFIKRDGFWEVTKVDFDLPCAG